MDSIREFLCRSEENEKLKNGMGVGTKNSDEFESTQVKTLKNVLAVSIL